MSKEAITAAATNTPQLQEASAGIGNAVSTGYSMAADGKLDGKDIGPLINFVLSNIENFKGIGTAFGKEMDSATEPDLVQAKAAFKQALGPDVSPALKRYTIAEAYSGVMCLWNIIRAGAIAEGRAQLAAELRDGTITFDQVISGTTI